MTSPSAGRPGALSAAAAALAARRAELNLTQEQLAQRARVVVRTVAYLEQAERWPQPRTRAAIERAVGWDEGELARIAYGVAS